MNQDAVTAWPISYHTFPKTYFNENDSLTCLSRTSTVGVATLLKPHVELVKLICEVQLLIMNRITFANDISDVMFLN